MVTIAAKDLQAVQFKYVNWKDEEHDYVIDVESISFGPYIPDDLPQPRWQLNGFLVTRDGDERKELDGPNRRRTFLLEKIESMDVLG